MLAAMNSPAAESLLTLLNTIPAPASADWPAILDAARQQGVAPLLYDRLRGLIPGPPEEISESLRQDYLKNAVRNTRLYQAFGELVRGLADRGIPVIALKGIHLAEAVYGNIALRPMGDLDLLVKPEDLDRAGTALGKLGYAPYGTGQSVRPDKRHLVFHHLQTGLKVDLHWTLLEDRYPFRIDTEGCWTRSQRLILGVRRSGGCLRKTCCCTFACMPPRRSMTCGWGCSATSGN